MNKIKKNKVPIEYDVMEHVVLLENDLWTDEFQRINIKNGNHAIINSSLFTKASNIRVNGRTLNNLLGYFGNPRRTCLPETSDTGHIQNLSNVKLNYSSDGVYELYGEIVEGESSGQLKLGSIDGTDYALNGVVLSNRYYLMMADVFYNYDNFRTCEKGIHFGGVLGDFNGKERLYDLSKYGTWQTIYKVVQVPASYSVSDPMNLTLHIVSSRTAKIKDIRLYEIDKKIYDKIDVDEQYSGANLIKKYPYVDGYTPIINPYIEKVGNLLKNASLLGLSNNYNSIGNLVDVQYTKFKNYEVLRYIVPYRQYIGQVFSLSIEGEYAEFIVKSSKLNCGLVFYDEPYNQNKNEIQPQHVYFEHGKTTLTTEALNNGYMHVIINTNSSSLGDTIDGVTREQLFNSFNEGRTKFTLVIGSEPKLYNEIETSSIRFNTTLYDGEYIERMDNGEYVVQNKQYNVKSIINLIDEGVQVSCSGTSNIYTHDIILNGLKQKVDGVIDLFGKAIHKDNNEGVYNSFYAGNWKDTYNADEYAIKLTIPNSISGWGKDYIPTSDEVRAFFCGYKMEAYDSTRDLFIDYNDSTNEADKYFVQRCIGIAPVAFLPQEYILNSNIKTRTFKYKITKDNISDMALLTLFKNPYDINTYKIIFKSKPYCEKVEYSGLLLINKDLNYIDIGSGFISKEQINLLVDHSILYNDMITNYISPYSKSDNKNTAFGIYNPTTFNYPLGLVKSIYDDKHFLSHYLINKGENGFYYNQFGEAYIRFPNVYNDDIDLSKDIYVDYLLPTSATVTSFDIEFDISSTFGDTHRTLMIDKLSDNVEFNDISINPNLLDNTNFLIQQEMDKFTSILPINTKLSIFVTDRWLLGITTKYENVNVTARIDSNEYVLNNHKGSAILSQTICDNVLDILSTPVTLSVDVMVAGCDGAGNVDFNTKNNYNHLLYGMGINAHFENGDKQMLPLQTVYFPVIDNRWVTYKFTFDLSKSLMKDNGKILSKIKYLSCKICDIYSQSDTYSNYELRIRNPKLELGTKSTGFISKLFNEELKNCQRWFNKSYPLNILPSTQTWYGIKQVVLPINSLMNHLGTNTDFPVEMELIPNIKLYSQAGFEDYISTGTSSNNVAKVTSFNSPSTKGFAGIVVNPVESYTMEQVKGFISTTSLYFHYIANCNIYEQ